MRYISCLLIICLFAALLSLPMASCATEQSGAAPDEQLASAVNAFAVDVYKQLALKGGNIFFSPYSISSAMAVAYAGARGNTAVEMAKVLHFTNYKSDIHAAIKSLQDGFDSIPEEDGALSVANRLWLDKKEELKPDYSALVETNYGASIEIADFFNEYEKARVEINNWVTEKTRDRIKNLLRPGEVNSITKLVLVNAIYFDSVWLNPFDKSVTTEEPFRTGKDKQRNVSMMHRTGDFFYGENAAAQWIIIPYRISGFYMTIFLPRENESFTQMKEFEGKLSNKALNSWMEDMRECKVAISMPKFKDRSRVNLTDILQMLGMNLAFDWTKADFSGMVAEPLRNGYTLCISDIIHQAFIELDEERTVAEAATAVVTTTSASIYNPDPEIEFRADRPFLYSITDGSGAILFMGRMADPR